jgi:hypothetical protein
MLKIFAVSLCLAICPLSLGHASPEGGNATTGGQVVGVLEYIRQSITLSESSAWVGTPLPSGGVTGATVRTVVALRDGKTMGGAEYAALIGDEAISLLDAKRAKYGRLARIGLGIAGAGMVWFAVAGSDDQDAVVGSAVLVGGGLGVSLGSYIRMEMMAGPNLLTWARRSDVAGWTDQYNAQLRLRLRLPE